MASLWRSESATASRRTANVRSDCPALSNSRPPTATIVVGDLALAQLPLAALIEGFRVNPKFAALDLRRPGVRQRRNGTFTESSTVSDTVPADRVFGSVLAADQAARGDFVPVQPGGQRHRPRIPGPGRRTTWRRSARATASARSALLAQPFHFAPRSTLRLQVTERTRGRARHACSSCSTATACWARRRARSPLRGNCAARRMCPVETIGNPDARIIPFDLRLSLAAHRTPGQPGRGRAAGQRRGRLRGDQHRLRARRRAAQRHVADGRHRGRQDATLRASSDGVEGQDS